MKKIPASSSVVSNHFFLINLMWETKVAKYHAFNAPNCSKQNRVVQVKLKELNCVAIKITFVFRNISIWQNEIEGKLSKNEIKFIQATIVDT
jgi:hypothetical protein